MYHQYLSPFSCDSIYIDYTANWHHECGLRFTPPIKSKRTSNSKMTSPYLYIKIYIYIYWHYLPLMSHDMIWSRLYLLAIPVPYDYGDQRFQLSSLASNVWVKWHIKYHITKFESPETVICYRKISLFTTNVEMDILEITLVKTIANLIFTVTS